MNKLSGAVLALAVLVLGGWVVVKSQADTVPAPLIATTVVSTPTAIYTSTPTPTVFQQHLDTLNPSLRKYVKGLYKGYSDNSWKFQRWDKLHQYINKVHKQSEKQYKINNPVSKKDIGEIVYGIKTFSTKWKLDQDWSVSYLDHESGFLDIIGDKYDKKTHKPNPPEKLSLGLGQVQLETAKGNLKARGYDPKGLTTDDLLYFRLMNLDISICVMAAKVYQLGRKNGTKAYNGGGMWWDGRSNQYYKDVLALYKKRSAWTTAK